MSQLLRYATTVLIRGSTCDTAKQHRGGSRVSAA